MQKIIKNVAKWSQTVCRARQTQNKKKIRAKKTRKTKKFFEGTIKGTISKTPRSGSGFGFDYIFIPKGSKKAYSQIPIEEKNKISMRVKALNKFAKYLIQ